MEGSPATLKPLDAAGQILLDGLTDRVELDMARQYVQDAHPFASRTELRRLTIDIIAWLLEWDLVVVGDLGADFAPWPLSAAQSIARIEREWTDPDRMLDMGAVCWLATTSVGVDVGRRLDVQGRSRVRSDVDSFTPSSPGAVGPGGVG